MRRLSRFGLVALVGAFLFLIAGVAACGGGSNDEPAAPTPATDPPPPSTDPPPPSTDPLPPSTEAPVSTTAAALPIVEEIMARGYVRVGILQAEIPPLAYLLDNEWRGFEPDIARLLVDGELGGIEIEWVGLASSDRFTSVANGDVDFVVRVATITPERRDLVSFTSPYMLDGPAVIVPTGAGVTDIAGLAGLRIAVMPGSPGETDLIEVLGSAGIVVEIVSPEEGQQPAQLVESGDADAYVAFWTLGAIQAAQNGNLTMIPLAFSSAIAAYTSPNEPEFAALLDNRLKTLIDAGIWLETFSEAFGIDSPWTMEEMAAAGG